MTDWGYPFGGGGLMSCVICAVCLGIDLSLKLVVYTIWTGYNEWWGDIDVVCLVFVSNNECITEFANVQTD